MKKTNKGFSLVELIIVIAIMAILAGAIAPALIKYIDKSRKSNDVSAAKTIKTAVETALGTESVYETLVNDGGSVILITPGKPCSSLSEYTSIGSAMEVKYVKTDMQSSVEGYSGATKAACLTLIGANIGETTPKIKYKKGTSAVANPDHWIIVINAKGTVSVGLTKTASWSAVPENLTKSDSGIIALAPDIDEDYQ
jgi:prepilin-type N-terminal cleavage/methylation domain-containing protein